MNRRVLTLTAIVLLSFGLRVWLAAAPVIPNRQQLADFPRQLGNWQMVAEGSVPDRLESVFGADDYILRAYRDEGGQNADLLIAYYSLQQAEHGPHSPKNCLPGSGWQPVQNNRVQLGVDAGGRPQWVNRYMVEKDGQLDVVLYWYQQHGRMIASEYWGKVYFIWDALRTRRRDGALVRVTVPIRQGSDGGAESDAALDLARASLPELPSFLPN